MRARGNARAREGGTKGELAAIFDLYFHFRPGNRRKPQSLKNVTGNIRQCHNLHYTSIPKKEDKFTQKQYTTKRLLVLTTAYFTEIDLPYSLNSVQQTCPVPLGD